MIAEKLNEFIEAEIEQRFGETLKELEQKDIELRKVSEEVLNLKKENNLLHNKVNQFTTFEILKSLVGTHNFKEVVSLLCLKESGYKAENQHYEPQWFQVLIEYYDDKDKVFSLLDLFDIKYPEWAKNFKMPYEYDEQTVELFLKNVRNRYICNGCIFDGNMGFFWESINSFKGDVNRLLMENRSFANYIPWQLFLKNPLLTTDKYFNMIIDALEKKIDNSHYFFNIQDYQPLSEIQIKSMFEFLPKDNYFDSHKRFIENNRQIIKNNSELADGFKDKINDSQYSSFYYLNYPLEYQISFIKSYRGYQTKLSLIAKMEITKDEKIKLASEILSNEWS